MSVHRPSAATSVTIASAMVIAVIALLLTLSGRPRLAALCSTIGVACTLVVLAHAVRILRDRP